MICREDGARPGGATYQMELGLVCVQVPLTDTLKVCARASSRTSPTEAVLKNRFEMTCVLAFNQWFDVSAKTPVEGGETR